MSQNFVGKLHLQIDVFSVVEFSVKFAMKNDLWFRAIHEKKYLNLVTKIAQRMACRSYGKMFVHNSYCHIT